MSVQVIGLLVINLIILLLRRRLAVCKHIFNIIHTKNNMDKSSNDLTQLNMSTYILKGAIPLFMMFRPVRLLAQHVQFPDDYIFLVGINKYGQCVFEKYRYPVWHLMIKISLRVDQTSGMHAMLKIENIFVENWFLSLSE